MDHLSYLCKSICCFFPIKKLKRYYYSFPANIPNQKPTIKPKIQPRNQPNMSEQKQDTAQIFAAVCEAMYKIRQTLDFYSSPACEHFRSFWILFKAELYAAIQQVSPSDYDIMLSITDTTAGAAVHLHHLEKIAQLATTSQQLIRDYCNIFQHILHTRTLKVAMAWYYFLVHNTWQVIIKSSQESEIARVNLEQGIFTGLCTAFKIDPLKMLPEVQDDESTRKDKHAILTFLRYMVETHEQREYALGISHILKELQAKIAQPQAQVQISNQLQPQPQATPVPVIQLRTTPSEQLRTEAARLETLVQLRDLQRRLTDKEHELKTNKNYLAIAEQTGKEAALKHEQGMHYRMLYLHRLQDKLKQMDKEVQNAQEKVQITKKKLTDLVQEHGCLVRFAEFQQTLEIPTLADVNLADRLAIQTEIKENEEAQATAKQEIEKYEKCLQYYQESNGQFAREKAELNRKIDVFLAQTKNMEYVFKLEQDLGGREKDILECEATICKLRADILDKEAALQIK